MFIHIDMTKNHYNRQKCIIKHTVAERPIRVWPIDPMESQPGRSTQSRSLPFLVVFASFDIIMGLQKIYVAEKTN